MYGESQQDENDRYLRCALHQGSFFRRIFKLKLHGYLFFFCFQRNYPNNDGNSGLEMFLKRSRSIDKQESYDFSFFRLIRNLFNLF